MSSNQPPDNTHHIHWKLDRELPVSIVEQIRGQIIYAISFGMLKSGDTLPSIRELAATLRVSPVTIARVYRELAQERLLVSKPSVGIFVGEMGLDRQQPARSNLSQIMADAVRQAVLMGYSAGEIQESFQKAVRQIEPHPQKSTLIVVGNFPLATRSYAEDIRGILGDLDLEVVSTTIDTLRAEPAAWTDRLNQASLIVTMPQLLRETRSLLEPVDAGRVAAIAYELSPLTIQQLSAIQPEQRVGIVSTFPDFVQTMVDELASYGLNVTPPLAFTIRQVKQIKVMLGQVDVLIYASGSEAVLAWTPPRVCAFEFLHTPKAESVNRLRGLLDTQGS